MTYDWIAAMGGTALCLLMSCGQREASSGTVPEEEFSGPMLRSIYLKAEQLNTPEAIDAWVSEVEAKRRNFSQAGPETITRGDTILEVSANLTEDEIILLHCQEPQGRYQQWYYLNLYQVPMLRELGREANGEYYERRFYYFKSDTLLRAEERRAANLSELSETEWASYQSRARGFDFRLDPAAVHRSALRLVQGE
jgi:hypothetical protein